MSRPLRWLLLSFLLAPSLLAAGNELPVLTFVTTGDCRVDPEFPPENPMQASYLPAAVRGKFKNKKSDSIYPFAFNYVQLKQTFDDIDKINPAPALVFFTGDLVMGFGANDKGKKLEEELAPFQEVVKDDVKDLRAKKCQVVFLPGNHETTFKVFVPTKSSGVDEDDTRTWNDWIKKNGYEPKNTDGPKQENADAATGKAGATVVGDWRKNTYSINVQTQGGMVHFVVLNTDSLTGQGNPRTLGLLPLEWVKRDIEAAQGNAWIKWIFVVGHKPIRPPSNFQGAGPDDSLNKDVAEQLRQVLVKNDKVVALICSHAHMWKADSLVPDEAPHGPGAPDYRRPVQIVAGNAGCPLEGFWRPEEDKGLEGRWLNGEKPGPFFGFTVVKVYKNGKVTFNSWQRPVPAPYYAEYAGAMAGKAAARARAMDWEIMGTRQYEGAAAGKAAGKAADKPHAGHRVAQGAGN
ncbi:MAG: metallophosphoesterase family protein [Holophaga sp.]|jgi:hypothetical protein